MQLNQLYLTYRCHCSIGNSLELESMVKEMLLTFITETLAIGGVFFVKKESEFKELISLGKNYILEGFDFEYKDSQFILNEEDNIEVITLKLKDSFLVLFYKNYYDDLEFIFSMLKDLKERMNIAITACFNVRELKRSNKELEDFSKNLQKKVEQKLEESKKKDRQLFEQSKMAQMGELIGNIAHHWRQPLSIVSTAASGLKLKKELGVLEDKDFEEYTDVIMNNVMFLSKTIDEFRDYINVSHRTQEVILQDRVNLALALVESSFSMENIVVVKGEIEKEPIHLCLILGELLQVLISVLNNAKDVLVSRNIENRWIRYSICKKGEFARVVIEDNGGGIDKDIVDKIFEPYFTTKHKSQGTGIGLYTSYDIVVNHLGGRLYAKNSECGVKFYIEIPLYKNDYQI